jgi:hypothetical protein
VRGLGGRVGSPVGSRISAPRWENIRKMVSVEVVKTEESRPRAEPEVNQRRRSERRTSPNVLRYRDDPNSDGDHTEHNHSRRGQLPHLFVPQGLWYSQSLLQKSCSDASVQVFTTLHSQSGRKVISIVPPTSQSTSPVESSSTF